MYKKNMNTPKKFISSSMNSRDGRINKDLVEFINKNNNIANPEIKLAINPPKFNITGHKIKWLKDLK